MAVDTGHAIYMRYFSGADTKIAYVAHFAGFLGGESVFSHHFSSSLAFLVVQF